VGLQKKAEQNPLFFVVLHLATVCGFSTFCHLCEYLPQSSLRDAEAKNIIILDAVGNFAVSAASAVPSSSGTGT
jgi:hypothetical protein